MNRSLLALGLLLELATVGCTTTERARGGNEAHRATSGDERGAERGTAPGESATDLEITRQIHAAVRGDGSLSPTARRVTIVTLGAVVTLRGNVVSNRERDAIARHARAVAGVHRIENAISIRASARE